MTPLLFCLLAFGAGTCNLDYQDWPNTNLGTYIDCVSGAADGLCIQAEAGPNQESPLGVQVVLEGQGIVSQDPGAVSYSWTQIDNGAPAVTLSDSTIANPSFTATAVGTYRFQLETEWHCRIHTDTVDITVLPAAVPTELEATIVATVDCQPVQVTAPEGDDRLFVVTKPGIINIIEGGDLLDTPFLDIQDLVTGACDGGSEQGLLGMAFDPDYETNGVFYLNYTGSVDGQGGSSGDTRIVAYQVSADPNIADATSASHLLTIAQPYTNHNGGQILFGPDNMLYISTGDGGSGGDPHNYGQNINVLLGKMLRYQTNGLNPLTIPADNPFVGVAGDDAIWAYGLRNPWRFSFDRQTGDMWIGDVGQANWEEINFQPANSSGGENYGWRLKEGDHCYNPANNCDPGGLTDPVFEVSHSAGWFSIIGGFVYRGDQIPGLKGYYLFTDWLNSQNDQGYTVIYDDEGSWASATLNIYDGPSRLWQNVVAFGEDGHGELYICASNGAIIKITWVRATR